MIQTHWYFSGYLVVWLPYCLAPCALWNRRETCDSDVVLVVTSQLLRLLPNEQRHGVSKDSCVLHIRVRVGLSTLGWDRGRMGKPYV